MSGLNIRDMYESRFVFHSQDLVNAVSRSIHISLLSKHLDTAQNLLVLRAAPYKLLSVHITTFNRFFNTLLVRLWALILTVIRICIAT